MRLGLKKRETGLRREGMSLGKCQTDFEAVLCRIMGTNLELGGSFNAVLA
jgi:hypothetical protein